MEPSSRQYSIPGTDAAGASSATTANPNPTVAAASSSARHLHFVPPCPNSTDIASPPPVVPAGKKGNTGEDRIAASEQARLLEEEMSLFTIDTSNMDERQREYINLSRDEVLAKRQMMARYLKAQSEGINAFGGMGGFGGYGGMGGTQGVFGGMGATAGAFGGTRATLGAFGGIGATSGAFGGYGGMGGMGLGGMGAPPGGFMASLVNNPSPSINVDGYGMASMMNNAPGMNVDGYGDSSRANTTHTTVQDSQG